MEFLVPIIFGCILIFGSLFIEWIIVTLRWMWLLC